MSFGDRRALVFGVLVLVAGGGAAWWREARAVDEQAQALESIAAEAAAEDDPALHDQVHDASSDAFRTPPAGRPAGVVPALHAQVHDAPSDPFRTLQATLRAVAERHGVASPIYTLRRQGDATEFVVMTNEEPYVGAKYELRPEMARAFAG